MEERLKNKLLKREEEGTMRSLSLLGHLTDLYSNDYLGLSKISIVTKFTGGSTGSRLISGNSEAAEHCEKVLAKWFKTEAALVFNSGYDANLGFFSSVPQRGDSVLYDEWIHASVHDGLRLSFAKSLSFRHNDVQDLEMKLQRAKGTLYVVIESLYSMDGDLAPLGKLVALCRRYKAYLIVDEAHACGVFGEHGRGIVDSLQDSSAVFARIITFGKAYGYHGAAVLGSKVLKQFLINYARSFIYTTALPPESYHQIVERVTHETIPERQRELQKKIQIFRSQFPQGSFGSACNSPIQMMCIGDVAKTKELAQEFLNHAWAVKPIFSPTVPKGKEGIRFCIHSYNFSEDVEK